MILLLARKVRALNVTALMKQTCSRTDQTKRTLKNSLRFFLWQMSTSEEDWDEKEDSIGTKPKCTTKWKRLKSYSKMSVFTPKSKRK